MAGVYYEVEVERKHRATVYVYSEDGSKPDAECVGLAVRNDDPDWEDHGGIDRLWAVEVPEDEVDGEVVWHKQLKCDMDDVPEVDHGWQLAMPDQWDRDWIARQLVVPTFDRQWWEG